MPPSPIDLRTVLMKDYEEHLLLQLGKENRTVLYLSGSDNKSQAFFSFLFPMDKTEDYLQSWGWEHKPGDLQPGFCMSNKGVTYDRFGHNNGAEPIVLVRTQKSDDVVELVEEFRLLYSLFTNAAGEVYRWTGTGDKEIVGLVTPAKVEIQTRLIRQFLAVKGKCLAIGFHHRRSFAFQISEISEKERAREYKDADIYLNFWLTDMISGLADEDGKTVATIAGKKIVRPLPVEECGVWPHTGSRKRSYESFIIGQTTDGEEILHSCAPEGLSDSFGNNPGLPHYVTEVCFSREVLSHYYNQTDKYSVGDGVVTCKGFWQLRIDNDGVGAIFVLLGDLGEIPQLEQLHWKRFNVPITGEMSATARARSFDGEFADPTNPELVFKQELGELEEAWAKKYGWRLFLPFSKEDNHILESLHVPAVSDQGNFDRQILNLAKAIVDRLNVKELIGGCTTAPANPGGINALEKYLEERQLLAVMEKLSVLRDIQALRSSGAAHHKGERYDQVAKRLGLVPDGLITPFRLLLVRSVELILALKKTT